MKFTLEINPDYWMKINDFLSLLKKDSYLNFGKKVFNILDSTREFIDYISSNDIKVYGEDVPFLVETNAAPSHV